MTEANLVRTELGGGDVELSDPSKLPAEPLVSVWMITYNHAPYIREALDSVLMQQVDFSYEICLGEDGSTDGTREICLEYANKHPDKIRLFLRDRGNPARAGYKVPFRHNTVETWNACRGKYIAMLEGDDYWTSREKLSQQVRGLDADPTVTIAAHYVIRSSDVAPWEARGFPPDRLSRFGLDEMLRRHLYVHTSSLMLRHIVSVEWNLFADAVCGDVPLLFCHLLKGDCLVSSQLMSVYRVNEGGSYTTQSSIERARRANSVWALLGRLVPEQMREAQQIGYAKSLTILSIECRTEWYIRESIRSLFGAIRVILALRRASLSEKASLLFDAIEGFLSPRLHRLRSRLALKIKSLHVKPSWPGTGMARYVRSGWH